VSKTPARKPAKPTPAKKAAAKTKPAAKSPAKSPAKGAPKPAGKSVKAAAKKAVKVAPKVPAKKPMTKPMTKPAAKAATKPAGKPASKVAAKPAGKPVAAPARPAAAPGKPAVAAKPEPTPVSAAAPKPAERPAVTPRPMSAKAAARAAAAAPPPLPIPAATSRFADRFAPPRPPARGVPIQELDAPKPIHKADPKLANAWKTKAGRELTDDELLAMPESEYMNEKQLDFFRAKLQALKDDLLSNAGETTEHLREDTTIVPDPADRATIEEEHALELRTRDRERKLLKKISQSLGRIESGEYGFCDETGEPIGLRRLIARPTATLSLEAQQRREMKQKMFGD
jgi:DnaK suppressor protein